MFLSFGKYRGLHVTEIPLSYLAWVYENLTEKPELHEAARAEIQRRVSGYECEPDTLDRDRLRRIYRTLAMEYHPDKGGDNGIMAGLNIFFAALTTT